MATPTTTILSLDRTVAPLDGESLIYKGATKKWIPSPISEAIVQQISTPGTAAYDALLAATSKVEVVSTGSLNDAVTPGRYAATSLSVLDLPAGRVGALEVTSAGTNITQRFDETAGGSWPSVSWTRRRISGTWTAWALAGWQGPFVPTNADFDGIRIPGAWPVQATSHPNQPTTATGTLEVLPATGLVIQRYTTWESVPRVYVRRATSTSAWSAWARTDVQVALAGTTLTTGDLNDIVDVGRYAATSLSLTNTPAGRVGALDVTVAGTNIIQRYEETAGGSWPTVTWTRRRISGTWGAWALAGWQGPFVPSAADFNTIRTPGAHPVQSTNHPNQPVPNTGSLEVLPAIGLVIQRYTTWESVPRIFNRRATSTTAWSAWSEAPSTAAISANTTAVADLTTRLTTLEQNGSTGLSAYEPTLTAKSPSDILTVVSTNKTRGWNGYGPSLKQTLDEGATWTVLYTFGSGRTVEGTTLLGDGELMISTMDSGDTGLRRMWKTSGVAANTAVTVTEVIAPRARGIKYTTAWSISTFENRVIVGEYGPKLGSQWGGYDVLPEENARYVYMSTNFGATFTQIFDLNIYLQNRGAGTDGQHVHGVAWDQYWDRIWISFGDTADGIVYSDDSGATWQTASWAPTSPSPTQVVGIVVLPDCLLFGGDTTPQVQRISRTPGKSGTPVLDVAYQTAGSHLMQAHQVVTFSDGSLMAFMGFGAEGAVAASFIVATRDGKNFTKVWEDPIPSAAGYGLRSISDLTASGKLVVGSNDQKDPGGLWSSYVGNIPVAALDLATSSLFTKATTTRTATDARYAPLAHSHVTTASELQGTGQPNGVVTATPGTYYTDTNGTNGAWRWLKTSGTGNTGWVVMFGDTGWRDITSTLSAGWTKTTTNGTAQIRRINEMVLVQITATTTTAALTTLVGSLPTGFRVDTLGSTIVAPTESVRYLNTADAGASVATLVDNACYYGGSGASLRHSATPAAITMRWWTQWRTNQAWPTVLPTG